jgi:hypothetical protein
MVAEAGVWLRVRTSSGAGPICYVRRPGVTPEMATTALARLLPRESDAAPMARNCMIVLLALMPYMLAFSAGMFLTAWLRVEWIP